MPRERRCAGALAALGLLAIIACPAAGDEPSQGSQAPAKPVDQPPSASPALEKPVIETSIDDLVRVLDTVQALDRPGDDGEPLGRIPAGVRIKAIGIVAGSKWVEIQLPNDNLAYVPRQSMAIDANGKAVVPTVDKITGAVSSVPNAATLVIGDRTVRLAGLDPGPPSVLGPFETWVKSRGSLECSPLADTGAFHCFTSSGIDVGEAAILNGAARVGNGASAVYRERETTARGDKRGLWGQP